MKIETNQPAREPLFLWGILGVMAGGVIVLACVAARLDVRLATVEQTLTQPGAHK